MSRNNGRVKKELFHLREKKRELKQRIGQSMSDSGPFGTTGKCKKLQREFSRVVKTEKSRKKQLRR